MFLMLERQVLLVMYSTVTQHNCAKQKVQCVVCHVSFKDMLELVEVTELSAASSHAKSSLKRKLGGAVCVQSI